MPSEHAPKVAAMGLINRAHWAFLDKAERQQHLDAARDEALVKIVDAARSRHLTPVGEPSITVAYVVKPGPPVQDLGPDDPNWVYVAVVAVASTMGLVE